MARRLLPGTYAKLAIDCDLRSGELRSIFENRVVGAVPPTTKSLYDFEGNIIDWDVDVDVIEQPGLNAIPRIFISGDGPVQQSDLDSLGERTTLAGIPKPAGLPGQPALTGQASNDLDVEFNTFYTFSLVNIYGEEGDKGDPTDSILVRDGMSATISDLGNLTAGLPDHALVAIRIYRITRLGANRLVAELPIGVNTFTDLIDEESHTRAPLFVTDDYFPPPMGLQGLHLMSNGVAIGFVGRVVYVSEPFRVGAWPYSFTVNSDVVGLSSFDNTAVIVTKGNPELATIYDPGNVNSAPLSIREPGVSKRSIVQGRGGVMYASPGALVFIGPSGYDLITDQTHDEHDWQDLQPQTFNSFFRDSQYIAFWGNENVGGGFVFDFRENSARVTRLSQWSCAGALREGTNELYLATARGTLELYQGGSRKVKRLYRSRTYGNGPPVYMSVGRVLCRDFRNNLSEQEQIEYNERRLELAASAHNESLVRQQLPEWIGFGGAIAQDTLAGGQGHLVNGLTVDDGNSIGGDSLGSLPLAYDELEVRETLKIFGDGELVDEMTYTSEEPERIAFSERYREWEWEEQGYHDVQQIDIAKTISEMGGH